MGVVIDLAQKRLEREVRLGLSDPVDQPVNGEFDTMMKLAEEAWSCRDPESLTKLFRQVRVCAEIAAKDWEEPVNLDTPV